MVTEHQHQQQERRETLDNDRRLQGTTLHAFAQEETLDRGRFSAVGRPVVIGSAPGVAAAYPAASPALQVELPPEPPTNYCIDEMVPLEPPTAATSSAQAPASPVPDDAPSNNPPLLSPDDERRGAGLGFSHQLRSETET